MIAHINYFILLAMCFHVSILSIYFVVLIFYHCEFQVLAANFIALIWNVILSFKAHKEILPKKVC